MVDCLDSQVYYSRLHRIPILRRSECSNEWRNHDFVSLHPQLMVTWFQADFVSSAMILWISQSGGDEYEYQLTV
jgi:hypothetical protein